MTNEEKQRIIKLKSDGYTYKSISSQTGTSIGTIKSILSRSESTDEVKCKECGKSITKPEASNSLAKYCSQPDITDMEVSNLFTAGNTIIVRNRLDTLGRVSQNQVLIQDRELLTKYDYDKTRVSKETLPAGDTITYSYDNMNHITAQATV